MTVIFAHPQEPFVNAVIDFAVQLPLNYYAGEQIVTINIDVIDDYCYYSDRALSPIY